MRNCFAVSLFISVFAVVISVPEWNAFKSKHSKIYETPVEEMHRYRNFIDQKHHVDAHNLHYNNGVASFKMGLNKFSDLTHDEFVGMVHGKTQDKNPIHEDKFTLFVAPDNLQLPKSVDWRTKGAVTDVEDQKFCAASWAFASASALESHHFLKTKHLLSLSEQNLIDCSGLYGNDGCDDGLPEQAFNYIHDHGIYTEDAYPYAGVESGHCILSVPNAKKANVTVRGFTRISSGNEEDLQRALALHGPISVAIDATGLSFRNYAGGIYHELSCSSDEDDLGHYALLVGYGTDEHQRDYYILKNSFGKSWGEAGYFKLSRNQGNHCGIASKAVFPNVD